VLAALTAFAWSSLLHPLGGDGYQVWSGIGSDVSEVAILVAVATWLRGRNCHISGCWRLSWHPHPDHGHPVCRRHHPDGGGVPA
jgi:hypothetical protein